MASCLSLYNEIFHKYHFHSTNLSFFFLFNQMEARTCLICWSPANPRSRLSPKATQNRKDLTKTWPMKVSKLTSNDFEALNCTNLHIILSSELCLADRLYTVIPAIMTLLVYQDHLVKSSLTLFRSELYLEWSWRWLALFQFDWFQEVVSN